MLTKVRNPNINRSNDRNPRTIPRVARPRPPVPVSPALDLPLTQVQAKEISKFPANRRDLALVVADNVPAGDIIEACKQAGGEKLTQVNLFDVYQGIGVASGHKSLAISLTIQDNEKTLEDDEINAVISAVLNEVKQRFNAELRD